MNILLLENISRTNQYIAQLSKAYQKKGHCVILGSDNFFYSNFIPDFVHIQWPESLYLWNNTVKNKKTIFLFEKRLRFYSENNVPVVYTIHNILPHDNPSLFDEKIFYIVSKFTNIFVHHGEKSIYLIKERYPFSKKSKHIVCPHGPYPYIKKDSSIAKKFYNLPENKIIYLNFGLQRPYKNSSFTTSVFKNLPSNNFLFTIGPQMFCSNKEESLKFFFGKLNDKILSPYYRKTTNPFSKNKKAFLREVKNVEIPQIMAATDAFFLGHKSGLNSGLLPLAASYKKPVVFPDIGNFKEQLIEWPWKKCYTPNDIASARKAVCNISSSIIENKNIRHFDNKKWLVENSWEKHVSNIIVEVEKL